MQRFALTVSALAIGVLVAFGVPGMANAQSLTAAQGGAALAPQASSVAGGKVSINLLTKSVTNGASGKTTTTYSYNGNGLLSKETDKGTTTSIYLCAYTKGKITHVGKSAKITYDKKGHISKRSGTECVVKYTCDKRGRVTKASKTYPSGKKIVENYKRDEKGRTVQYKCNSNVDYGSGALAYDYVFETDSYDKRSNIKTIKQRTENNGSWVGTINRAITGVYKNALLTKRVASVSGSVNTGASRSWTEETTYTYKTVKVPVKYATTVEAQQWALLNRNNNGAFPI